MDDAAPIQPTRDDFREEEGPSDAFLVEQARSGDITAFDQLILRYQRRLYGVLYNMTSNHEDTNDLLMETFDKAFRSLGTFKGDCQFYTWLYRIGVNRAINEMQRKRHRMPHFSLNDMDLNLENETELRDFAPGSDPERTSQLQELQKKLNESLQRLSEEHRAVVVLFDIEGLPHAEIAAILGCSEGTVRSRLHYAHKQLKKMLRKYL